MDVNTYLVRVHYRDATGEHFMPYKVQAPTWGEAKTAGLAKFEEFVTYNRTEGHWDFPDLEITAVRPRFLGCGVID